MRHSSDLTVTTSFEFFLNAIGVIMVVCNSLVVLYLVQTQISLFGRVASLVFVFITCITGVPTHQAERTYLRLKTYARSWAWVLLSIARANRLFSFEAEQ